MNLQVQGTVIHNVFGQQVRRTQRVVTAKANDIRWVGDDILSIDGINFYGCVVQPIVDVADKLICDRIAKYRRKLDEILPALVLEYDSQLEWYDPSDVEFPINAAKTFYDVLERAGKAFDINGAPIRA